MRLAYLVAVSVASSHSSRALLRRANFAETRATTAPCCTADGIRTAALRATRIRASSATTGICTALRATRVRATSLRATDVWLPAQPVRHARHAHDAAAAPVGVAVNVWRRALVLRASESSFAAALRAAHRRGTRAGPAALCACTLDGCETRARCAANVPSLLVGPAAFALRRLRSIRSRRRRSSVCARRPRGDRSAPRRRQRSPRVYCFRFSRDVALAWILYM